MKRFAVASLGSRGDVEPFVLLATALAERGHAVTLAVDDGYLARLPSDIRFATRSLGHLELGSMVNAVEHAVRATSPIERSREGYQRFVGHRRDELRERIVSLAADHDVVVIGDSLAFLENGRLPWTTRTALVWYTQAPDSELRRLRDVAALHLVALPDLVASRDSTLRAAFCYTGFWFGPDRGPLDAELESFLAAGSPPMFLTMGSMAGFDGAALVAAFLAAARSLGQRAIIQRGWQNLVADGPDVRVVNEVNYTRLFPRCAAAFIHGGTGTVANALRAGVATAIVPLVADQIAWAQALAEVGIGSIDPRSPDEAAIATAMKRALDPGGAVTRATLASRVGVDGLAIACDLLEQ